MGSLPTGAIVMEQQIEVGDWVRINTNYPAVTKMIGSLGLVTYIDDNKYPVICNIPSSQLGNWYFNYSELTLVSKSLKEPTKEIQVGDWVRINCLCCDYTGYMGYVRTRWPKTTFFPDDITYEIWVPKTKDAIICTEDQLIKC